MTMDSCQIRHKNFMTLFQEFIARRPELPRRGMLKLFAQHLEFSDRYLSHIKCKRKNIGSAVARSIEQRLGLARGWMDRDHDALALPTDERERLFLETALTLFRAEPVEARDMLLDLLRQRLSPQPMAA